MQKENLVRSTTVRLNFSLQYYVRYIKIRKPKLGFGLRGISPLFRGLEKPLKLG